MLKYYLCLYLLLYFITTCAQTTIANYSFEASDTWLSPTFSTPPCTLQDDTWNVHSSLGTIRPSDGSFFWGIQDLNGNCGSSGFESIEFPNVDISHFRNIRLSFDVQVLGYDNGDDMTYNVWLDDEAQPEVLFIDGSNNLNTDGWITINIDIPNNTKQLKFKISVKQNGSDMAGIDNIIVLGEPISPCTEIMISEYLEGTSSRTVRNNYIELYNPTGSDIDLSAYVLVKYSGKNTIASSSLSLSGNIPAHDTYLIEDDQENLNIDADLSTNSAVMNYNGDDKLALKYRETIIDLIGIIGDSTVFAKDLSLRRKSMIQSPNNQFDPFEWDTYGLEEVTNLNQHTSYCEGPLPEIVVEALGRPINDGSKVTTLNNNTYFGSLPFEKDSLLSGSYTIKNVGTKDLEIYEISISGEEALDFNVNFTGPKIVVPNDSLTFSVDFKPSSRGLSTARVIINNNDPSENPFDFLIQGEGTGHGNDPLIISQYYEGDGNNKWLEVTNIGQEVSPENMYYLALFWNQDTQNPIGSKPSRKKLIPSLNPGQTLKFSATLNVNGPAYAIDGQEIKTTVCSFTGDDIIVISTSGDEACWENRTDIIGKSGNWGTNLSMIRKYGCQQNGSNTGFELGDWLIYPFSTIDDAASGNNLRHGEHYSGPVSFQNGSWQNGLPDLQRETVIISDYNTEINGSIAACDLTILKGVTLNVSAGTYLQIQNNLVVKGSLEVMNEGSLVMINDTGLVDNQGDIFIHKSTTQIKPYDYTYWSSPVKNAELETVFDSSPKNSFYLFSTKKYDDQDQDGLDDNDDAWVRVSGAMDVARGYTSMAPNAPLSDRQKVIFQGEVNNGTIQAPIGLQQNASNPLNDWNLIGNPYPSAIDANLLLMHPSNKDLLSSSLYFWTHNTARNDSSDQGGQAYSSDDYAMYTLGTGGIKANSNGQIPNQYIASCQGFFVEAQRMGNLRFSNDMRTLTNNNNFFKKDKPKYEPEENKLWLNLYNEQGAFSQILIGFIQGASKQFDHEFDGLRLSGNQFISFYARLDQLALAIMGTPPFQGDEVIKLGLENHISEPVNLKIGIEQINGELKQKNIYLYDKLKDISHNLKEKEYQFELEHKGVFNDRFELRFQDSIKISPDLRISPNKIIWYTQNNSLYVRTSSNDQIRNLKIYDFNGRKIKDLDLDTSLAELQWVGLPSRVMFLLRVKLSDSRILTSRIFP